MQEADLKGGPVQTSAQNEGQPFEAGSVGSKVRSELTAASPAIWTAATRRALCTPLLVRRVQLGHVCRRQNMERRTLALPDRYFASTRFPATASAPFFQLLSETSLRRLRSADIHSFALSWSRRWKASVLVDTGWPTSGQATVPSYEWPPSSISRLYYGRSLGFAAEHSRSVETPLQLFAGEAAERHVYSAPGNDACL